jgi:hypothetical protein
MFSNLSVHVLRGERIKQIIMIVFVVIPTLIIIIVRIPCSMCLPAFAQYLLSSFAASPFHLSQSLGINKVPDAVPEDDSLERALLFPSKRNVDHNASDSGGSSKGGDETCDITIVLTVWKRQ